MSDYMIKSIARVVDVNRVMPGGLPEVSNELHSQPRLLNKDATLDVSTSSSFGQQSTTEGNHGLDIVSALRTLFSSFFTQLQNLLSDTQRQVPLNIPSPSQPVAPQVLPEPVAPMPSPALNLPALSNKRNGARPDNIWSGFRQGPDGNCVTVSAIKAAMHRFGQSPTDIFKEVTKTSDGYHVLMRDGFKLSLTDRELAEGARGARFIGPDKGMLKDAQFLFAVSAKRAQMENNDGRAARSFQAAVRSLNDGEDERGPGEGFLRLGLKGHIKRVSVRDLAEGQLGMCNRTGHSVAVINGREELWGRQGAAPTRGQALALM